MAHCFNIAGPCMPKQHYMLPPGRRAVEAMDLIAQGRWFSLVAGRQTGKTTTLKWLADSLEARGDHLALWIDLENARDRSEPADAMPVVLGVLADALHAQAPTVALPDAETTARWLETPDLAVSRYLQAVCKATALPVVLLLDEADVLVGPAMVSFLTQLRSLYLDRDRQPCPWSVVLAGSRSVRDYALTTDDRRALSWLGSASPFNVTVENVGLAHFTASEVAELTAQHTAETGQRFEEGANLRVWVYSQGHPWLVSALADQCTRRDVTNPSMPITAGHIDAAKETLITERRTHIDSLVARLREDRVRRVIDPMIAGRLLPGDMLDDDVAYVAGLGLIRLAEGSWEVANPIYREVIPRALTFLTQTSIAQKTAWYVGPDGLLDVPKLMAAWQEFWREDGHLAAEGFAYKESGPHLVMMAFLQRVVNGGGSIDREYALGRDALDLLVTWKTQRIAFELKIVRRPTTEAKGLAQLGGYLDALGLDEGWLVLFDNDPKLSWEARVFTRVAQVGARRVHVIGC